MSEFGKSGYHGPDSMREKAEKIFRESGEMKEISRVVPGSYSARSRDKTRFYAKGGHVEEGSHCHKMEKSQYDMKIPRITKTPVVNVENFEKASRMRKGGKVHKKADGGLMQNAYESNMANNALNSMNPAVMNAPNAAMKRGGKVRKKAGGGEAAQFRKMVEAPTVGMRPMKKGGSTKKKAEGGKMAGYARGGNVYERDMEGEHHHSSNHYRDYLAEMRGEHGEHAAHDHSHIGKSKGTPYAEGGYAMGGVGKIRHKESTKSGKQTGGKGSKGSPFA
jgi:hypothetical protein